MGYQVFPNKNLVNVHSSIQAAGKTFNKGIYSFVTQLFTQNITQTNGF